MSFRSTERQTPDNLEIRFPRVDGYRTILPTEQLSADFNDDHILELTPDLVGPTITRNEGIIGEGVDLDLSHTGAVRFNTILMELTKHLLMSKWRDPNESPKLHLFGQLKIITKQWLESYLKCSGGTYPSQILYQSLADMACERITAAVIPPASKNKDKSIQAIMNPYNPEGSTRYVNFTTSKDLRWETDARKCHLNWIVLDSEWEGEFCRVAESHSQVLAYVKNHNLGFEVPYLFGGTHRRYIPDFIVLVDDGHGTEDPLHLIVEIKGYRGEDAKEKKSTMETQWLPAVNALGQFGRWAFVEFTDLFEIEEKFSTLLENIIKKEESP